MGLGFKGFSALVFLVFFPFEVSRAFKFSKACRV